MLFHTLVVFVIILLFRYAKVRFIHYVYKKRLYLYLIFIILEKFIYYSYPPRVFINHYKLVL